ncbi:MAG: terminase family protein [Candidatus Pacearchaeota archaeon]|nr:terminase family protein [Candidatus Pacearchaeota archaeon]
MYKTDNRSSFALSILTSRYPLQPKQEMVQKCNANMIFYGGAGGGGKSFLIRWLACYYATKYAGLQVYLFRKTYPELISNHLTGAHNILDLLSTMFGTDNTAWKYDKSQKIISFYNGSKIFLRHITQADMHKYFGAEIHCLLVDEATLLEPEVVQFLLSRNRVSKHADYAHLEQDFPKAIFASNPVGPSFLYFKRLFVDDVLPYEVFEKGNLRYAFFPARVEDNKFIDAQEYEARLKLLNPQMFNAIRYGEWVEPETKYFTEFDNRHILKPFQIPPAWELVAGLDLGFSDPTAFVLGAISDGRPVMIDGVERKLPKNSVVFFKEKYFCDPFDPSKGTKLPLREVARQIAELLGNLVHRVTIYTDLYFHQRNIDINAFQIFNEYKLNIVVKTKKRKTSFNLLVERLKGENPLVYFVDDCKYAILYMRTFNKDKKGEPAQEGEATHMVDAIRLALNFVPMELTREELKELKQEQQKQGPTMADILRLTRINRRFGF